MTLHSSVGSFLENVSHKKIETLEKEVICDEIAKAATPLAHKIAAERAKAQRYELGEAERLTIKGYATPKPSLVAVAFEVSFDLRLFDQKGSEERQLDTRLTMDGSCSYDPVKKEASDVLVKSWRHNVKGQTGSYWATYDDPAFRAQMEQTRYI